MFEFSVACKYLIPRRRQLSVSIISLISVLVIALVVWLIVVFFSVTEGLEKTWVHKLTALTAPVRMTPTDAYYHSYYYQVDSISEASGYTHKTIREKLQAPTTDPYDPTMDEEIPAYWSLADQAPDGSLKDLVQLAYASVKEIEHVPGLQVQDFELTATQIKLFLQRDSTVLYGNNLYGGTLESSLAYPAYLGNFDLTNHSLMETLLPIETKDLNNFLRLMGSAENHTNEETQRDNTSFSPIQLQQRLKNFFQFATIERLQTRQAGWVIPRRLLPSQALWVACAVVNEEKIVRVVLPQTKQELLYVQNSLEEQGLRTLLGQIQVNNKEVFWISPSASPFLLTSQTPLTLAGNTSFIAQLEKTSLDKVKKVEELRFQATLPIQGDVLSGTIPYRGLEINQVAPQTLFESSLWMTPQQAGSLPTDPEVGEGIMLPKSFRDAGVLIGDRGTLSYVSPTVSVLQENFIPVYVAGFYDPGIIPIGGKFILASPETTALIRSSHSLDDKTAVTNGINIRFDHLNQAEQVKEQLLKALKAKGIHRYWTVETYRDYEFTKEIMHELQSQKNLFTLIALVIIVVACSNIISMLVILVNDKKTEIGILRSMGASSKSIAFIFGLAGALIGVGGSFIGIVGALFTLNYLNTLLTWMSYLQGHDVFSRSFYGQVVPHELSLEALGFVLLATGLISLLAGIVPAVKACLLRPSHILRAAGG
jgi:lipoprotein-releasing system permease protein